MKVKEFIEYLRTLPPKTNVHGRIFEELLDMRANRFAKGKDYENDVDLYLGEK